MRWYGKDADFFNYKRDDYISTLKELVNDLNDRKNDTLSDVSKEWIDNTINIVNMLIAALE